MPVTSARLVITASSVELFYAQDFQQLAQDKFRVVDQVTPPEPPRLRQQAKQPFQAMLADQTGDCCKRPAWRSNGCPMAHEYRDAKASRGVRTSKASAWGTPNPTQRTSAA